jgi:hypothetical protein
MAAKKKYKFQEVPFVKKAVKLRQGHSYEEIFSISVLRVRIKIYIDGTDWQSTCKAEVWSSEKLEWNTVTTLTWAELQSLKTQFNYSAPANEARFAGDVETLKKQVRFILQMDEMV